MSRKQPVVASVPPELVGTVPRTVRLSGAGVIVAALALLSLAGSVLAAVWLSQIALFRAKNRDRFDRESVTVPGRVVGLGPIHDGRRGVAFSYVAGAQERHGHATLSRREWKPLSPGSEIPVRYVPAEPSRAHVLGHGPETVPFWAAPLTAVSLALAAALIAFVVRSQWRLLELGRPTVARVIASKRGPQGHRRVQYEYTVLSGAVHRVWQEMKTGAPEPGASMVVLYDPDNQRRASRYPLPLVRTRRT